MSAILFRPRIRRAPGPARVRWSLRAIVGVGTVVGIAGGIALAGVLMGYGILSDARTAWDAPMAISAWAFGQEHFGEPANHVWPIVLGAWAHIGNSVIAGLVLTLPLAGVARRELAAPAILGTLYALALWGVMRYVVLPMNEAEAALFTTDIVAPASMWWLAHAAAGAAAGATFHAARRLVGERDDRPERVELARLA